MFPRKQTMPQIKVNSLSTDEYEKDKRDKLAFKKDLTKLLKKMI